MKLITDLQKALIITCSVLKIRNKVTQFLYAECHGASATIQSTEAYLPQKLVHCCRVMRTLDNIIWYFL
jgi:hypothetical protein